MRTAETADHGNPPPHLEGRSNVGLFHTIPNDPTRTNPIDLLNSLHAMELYVRDSFEISTGVNGKVSRESLPTICGVEFSFTDCGGSAGFWGGIFGGHVAEYNREFGGLPPNIAGALATHNQRVNDQLDANRANAAYRQWMATGRAEDYARFEAIMQNTNLVQVRCFLKRR
jgi:hypothetical protein